MGTLLTLWSPGPARALDLAEAKTKPDDLAVSGDFTAVPTGATRYVHHDDLLALPEITTITEEPSKGMGQHECTVLYMDDFLKYLPLKQGADCLLLRCADKWRAFTKRTSSKAGTRTSCCA